MRVFVFILLFCQISNGTEGTSFSCDKVKDKIKCLLENYDEQKKDRKHFEELFLDATKHALKCNKPNDIANFLKFSQKTGGSAAIEEYFSQALEKDLILKNPKCFFSGLNKAAPEVRDKICSMLKTPLFLEQSQVDDILKKYQGKEGPEGWLVGCLKKK